MRIKRFLLVALCVLAVVVIGGFFFARYYLHSPQVAHQVAQRLQAMYGGPVRVDKVEVGVGGSSLSGFELFEEGSDANNAKPWLTVGSIDTDISLWDLIRGQAMPKHVTLKQVKVLLRFDAAGHLITQFPAHSGGTFNVAELNEVPDVVLEGGEVVLHKEGQKELVADNVSATVSRNADGKIVLAGTGDSKGLGKLLLDGSVAPKSAEAVVTLQTAGIVPVTQPLLTSVPFVPAVTWQELQVIEGESSANLTVRYNLNDKALHWRLALAPQKTTARIPVLDLAAHDAAGAIIVDDYRIDIPKIDGKAYGGQVQIAGDLDFSTPEYKFNFPKIKLTGLDVAKVPDSWNPAELETLKRLAPNGKLSGTASVTVTMGPGKVAPRVVDSFIGLTASSSVTDGWVPAVAALSAFPSRELHTQSTGKATITGLAGGTAEIELKLGPHSTQPASTPVKTSQSRVLTPKVSAEFAGGVAAFDRRLIPPIRSGSKPITTTTSFQKPPAGPDAYPYINAQVARTADKVVDGIQSLLRDIVGVGGEMVGSLPKKVAAPAPVTPETPTSYLDLNLKLKDVDIAQLVKGLRIKLNTPVAGKMSVQVKVSIPTNRAANLKEYKLKGTAQAVQIQFDGIHVATLDADISYQGGVLDLSSLKGRFAAAEPGQPPDAGTFTGRGTLQVVPLGAMSADLTLDRIPVSAVAGLMSSKEPLGGTLSGKLTLRGPGDKLKDLAAFEGSGKLSANQVSAYGYTLAQVTTDVELKGGVLRLADLHSTFAGTPITASGELRLTGDYAFKAKADLKNWNLATLEKVAAKGQEPPVKISGSFTTTVDVQGALKPFKLDASGDASAAALTVDKFQVSKVRFHWTTDGKTLDLSKLNVELYGGQATGTAALPLQSTAGGAVNLKVSDLDAKQLVKDLAVPVKITGKVGGVVKGTLAPVPPGKTRTGTFDLAVTAPALTVQNIPTQQLRGKLDYKNGIVDYKLEGKTLGGTFEVDGQVPSGEPVKKESSKGKLRINDISLAQLSQALGLTTAPVSGRLSVELDYTQAALNEMPEGSGKLRFSDFRWQGMALPSSLTGDLTLTKGVLQLRELKGEIAQGIARLGLTYDLRHPERGRFSLDLQNVDAAKLLAPWTGEKVKGTMQARIRGTLGATLRGSADVELTGGQVAGMEIAQWSIPAEWAYSPATGRAEVHVQSTEAQVARGRLLGKLDATSEYGWRVDGNVRFFGVDLQTLIRPFLSSTTLAAGTVTGQFSFTGNNVHSIDDLSGNITASFSQAQALQVPGLSAITPYIGMGPTTTFQRGSLRAQLDHGVLRIQSLALVGGTFKLFADGTMSLAGALNLNVVAKTGDVGLPTCRIGVLGLRIPITGPLPVTLLVEASNLLANQVVYLQVTGTIHSPVVRVRTLQMLSEEAVRFFILQSNLPIPLAP